MLLYNLALDDVDNHDIYLHLWQIMESIYSDGNSTFDLIKKRIKRYFKNNDELSYLINICIEKRNILVHKGTTDHIEQDDVDNLKLLVDSSFIFLIFNENKFRNTEELIYFYDNLGSSNKRIKRKINILNLLIK